MEQELQAVKRRIEAFKKETHADIDRIYDTTKYTTSEQIKDFIGSGGKADKENEQLVSLAVKLYNNVRKELIPAIDSEEPPVTKSAQIMWVKYVGPEYKRPAFTSIRSLVPVIEQGGTNGTTDTNSSGRAGQPSAGSYRHPKKNPITTAAGGAVAFAGAGMIVVSICSNPISLLLLSIGIVSVAAGSTTFAVSLNNGKNSAPAVPNRNTVHSAPDESAVVSKILTKIKSENKQRADAWFDRLYNTIIEAVNSEKTGKEYM